MKREERQNETKEGMTQEVKKTHNLAGKDYGRGRQYGMGKVVGGLKRGHVPLLSLSLFLSPLSRSQFHKHGGGRH